MGLSHVGAAAILWAGTTFIFFGFAKDTFDQSSQWEDDWSQARDHDLALLQAAIRIDDVTESGGTVTVTLTNDGAITHRLSTMTLLFDGTPVTVASSDVQNVATDIWPPAMTARLNVTTAMPTDVAAATGEGVQAFWRS